MDFADTLKQLIEKSGYVVADPKRLEEIVQLASRKPPGAKQLAGLVNAMYQSGTLRLQGINPKDDEAFRLFPEDSP